MGIKWLLKRDLGGLRRLVVGNEGGCKGIYLLRWLVGVLVVWNDVRESIWLFH